MPARFLTLLLVTLTLAGCGLFAGRGESTWVPIPQEAKTDCPDPRSDPFPISGSHNDVEAWGVRWGLKYQKCRDGKRELVRAVERREREDAE